MRQRTMLLVGDGRKSTGQRKGTQYILRGFRQNCRNCGSLPLPLFSCPALEDAFGISSLSKTNTKYLRRHLREPDTGAVDVRNLNGQESSGRQGGGLLQIRNSG